MHTKVNDVAQRTRISKMSISESQMFFFAIIFDKYSIFIYSIFIYSIFIYSIFIYSIFIDSIFIYSIFI